MIDIGVNAQNQMHFLRSVDMEPEFHAHFSKMYISAYKDNIIPHNCNPRNVRRLRKIIGGSKGYARKNMFKKIKNNEKKERLLDNYFE